MRCTSRRRPAGENRSACRPGGAGGGPTGAADADARSRARCARMVRRFMLLPCLAAS